MHAAVAPGGFFQTFQCGAHPWCAAVSPEVTLGGIPETWTGGTAAGDHPPPGAGGRPPLAAGTAACAHPRRRAATVPPGLQCCGQLCLHQGSELVLSCSSAVRLPRHACCLAGVCMTSDLSQMLYLPGRLPSMVLCAASAAPSMLHRMPSCALTASTFLPLLCSPWLRPAS